MLVITKAYTGEVVELVAAEVLFRGRTPYIDRVYGYHDGEEIQYLSEAGEAAILQDALLSLQGA